MYKLKSQLPFGALAQKLILIRYSGHRKKVCEKLYQVSLTIDIDLTVPVHTKSYFAKYDILTKQNEIVLNALIFMHKARHFPLDLPGPTHESSSEWLQNLSYHLYTRSVFIKAHFCR